MQCTPEQIHDVVKPLIDDSRNSMVLMFFATLVNIAVLSLTVHLSLGKIKEHLGINKPKD